MAIFGSFCLAGKALAAPSDPWEGGQWGPVLDWPHIAVSGANLPDGRILTWSGSERETWPSTEQTYSATWDPKSGVFEEVFHPSHNMFCAHLAMMEDGRVFVNGGRNQTNSPWTSLFDYRDNEWVQVENMASGGRWYPTTLMLPDGDIFTAIGTATIERYPERWDPQTGWQIQNGIDFDAMVLNDYFDSGTHGESRWWPLLHVAPNGQIFHSGPTPKMHYIDPTGNGSYQQAGSEFSAWYHKHGTTIMYDEGKLLTAGGWIDGTNIASTNQAFTIDLNGPSPVVALTDSMQYARKYHNGIMLPNGEVLVIGGNTSGKKFNDEGTILAVEIWNPDTGTWREGSSMAIPRNYHSIALLLADGRVLAAGSGYCSGSANCNGSSHKDGQVYSPPYLFDNGGNLVARPSITSAPGKISGSQVFSVQATANLQRFTMIKMSSTTHGVNTDVRFIEVPFTETSPGSYQLTAHSNQNVLTPGYWMLFGLNADGVPTEAQIMQANTTGMPWIAAIGEQASPQLSEVSFQVNASDNDNDPLVYSAAGLPTGLSIDINNDLITGFPTDTGTFPVTITVTDNDEGTVQTSFDWVVINPGLGQITRDWWTGISGNAISEMTSQPGYPDSPDGTEELTLFEGPTGFADNYGSRIYGYLVPDTTGSHTFWVATDDNGELWLSTDSDPANRQLIATVPGYTGARQWDKYSEQQSAPIVLQAGQSYFIEALQKEGGGGDNLAVGWLEPGASGTEVIPGKNLSTTPFTNVEIEPLAEAKSETGLLVNIGSDWTTVSLDHIYDNPVIIATPQYENTELPAVTRIRNATGNQFDIRVQNPSDTALSGYTVHYFAIESGVYREGANVIEAVRFTSNLTDEDNSWSGEPRQYQQIYSNPVVIGQIMSHNDPGWSVFWASDGDASNPPSAGSLHVGKHVAEDTDVTRAPEVIGYLVAETGSGFVGDLSYAAAVGSDTIGGIADAPPYLYPLSTPAITAIASIAGMDGGNGGWPVLIGDDAVTATTLGFAIDEDQIGDAERSHTNEQAAYMTFDVNVPVSFSIDTTAPHVTGSELQLSVDANVNYLQYKWSFGDGTPETPYSSDPAIQHIFAEPGRYVVAVSVFDPTTLSEQILTTVQLVHAPITSNPPDTSGPITFDAATNRIWNVNPDNDTVSVIDAVSNTLITEIPVDDRPVSVGIVQNGDIWVVNKTSATVLIFDAVSLSQIDSFALPAASNPHGLAIRPGTNEVFISLEATGDILRLDTTTKSQITSTYVGPNPRYLSVTHDGARVLVSRFITPTLPNEDTASPVVESGGVFYGGEILSLDATTLALQGTAVLRHSDRLASEHTGPGIPNYLGPAVISPDGLAAWVPSKQDNILAGALRGGTGMTFDQTVRAITSKIDLTSHAEVFSQRIDHDNAGVASYAVFGPFGIHLFTALETNREVVVSDAASATELVRFDVGMAPQGLAISDDGNTLYVSNFMDRSVSVIDISAIIHDGGLSVTQVATIPTVASETLPAEVLLGKKLFYDARDPRLALDSYMSCASCHNAGRQDGRIWDFTGVGEGLRNTITLEGRSGMGHGFLHWSANFDEVQDFEAQIRNVSLGTGLMDDSDYFQGTRSEPMGDTKAGISPDLDALAAYIASLNTAPNSPYRNADGSLTADGAAGLAIFARENCAACHDPLLFTDSGAIVLHDIGTMKNPESGQRLGGPLNGIDTPTLLGIWDTAPFLHDGSAFDVTAAVQAHDGIDLTGQELVDLGAFLEQLDNVTAAAASDGDQDGIPDILDNCLQTENPDQRDTDDDNIGNRCDPDLNNDGQVTVSDFLILRSELNTANQDADLNGDGTVTASDFLILRNFLNQPPGPSGIVAP